MEKNYKPIVPAPEKQPSEATTATTVKHGSQAGPMKRKRISTAVACNECRSRRVACDGKRPACRNCATRSMTCVYISATPDETPAMAKKREMESLQTSKERLIEFTNILRTLPEAEAIELLRKFRTTAADPEHFLSAYRKDSLSPLPRYLQTRPAAQGSVEFDLMMRHAIAYPTLVPLDCGAVGISSLLATGLANRTLFQSAPDGRAKSNIQPSAAAQSQETALYTNVHPLALNTGASYKTRLSHLSIGYWSRVQLTDDYASTLISLYLGTDHLTLTFFDTDLFLSDLIGRRTNHCSSLLVAAILSWSCHAYSSIDPNTDSLRDAFYDEATYLWRTAQMSDTLPTVAASQLMSLDRIFHGQDGGLPYLDLGVQMAQRMGLFGLLNSNSNKGWRQRVSDDSSRARAQTAWGVYNWVVMRSLMFQKAESAIHYPPMIDYPGEKFNLDSRLVVGIEPLHKSLKYRKQIFPAMCEFWVLTSKWTAVYYAAEGGPVISETSFSFAHTIFQELLAWSDSLDTMLARGDQSDQHETTLHIWFHAAVTELFRPFTYRHITTSIQCDATEVDFAKRVLHSSSEQLKHLAIVFRQKFPCASYTMFWHIALLQVANTALQDPTDPQWHDYLTFCLDSYATLYRSFRVAAGIVKSILGIALRLDVMKAIEAQEILNRVLQKDHHDTDINSISTSFIIDLNLAVTDRKAAELVEVGHSFDEMSLFHQFFNLEPTSPLMRD